MLESSKKIITALLVTSFIVSPYFLSLPKAEAQSQFPEGYRGNPSSGYSASSVGSKGPGVLGYITGLSSVITQLPLCKNAATKGKMKNLVPGGYAIGLAGGAQAAADYAKKNSTDQEALKKQAEYAKSLSNSVRITNETEQDQLADIQQKQDAIKKSQEALEVNDTCIKSIGRLIAKRLFQKFAQMTASWIQRSREGDTAFIQNKGEFLRDLAQTEILQFGTEINNSALFPYGKDFITRQAQLFNQKFAQNAQYSLNKSIQDQTPQYSDQTFKQNFDEGGWNAWHNFTQVDANNPIGFGLMATNELASRISGGKIEANNLLQQGRGFLGDERCADPKGLTKKEHKAALVIGQPDGFGGIVGTCNRWEYVTPGAWVADLATKNVHFTDQSILSAQDINDAVALVMDSLANRWIPDLINQGVSKFNSGGADGYYQIDSQQYGYNYTPTQVESDFNASSITGFLEDNPNFNIRRDLNQALIDEQRIYVEKITEQNKVLPDLIKTTYQLDYCQPGPHPGWKEDSWKVLAGVENAIVSKTPADMEGLSDQQIQGLIGGASTAGALAIGLIIGGSIGGPIGAIAGVVISVIAESIFGGKNEEKLDQYYGGVMTVWTGLNISKPKSDRAYIGNKQEVTNALDAILGRYSIFIDKYFTPDFLPTSAKEAAVKFSFIPGYKEMISDNTEKISILNGVIKRLTDLKEKIDANNAQYYYNTPEWVPANEDIYEAEIKTLANEFSRLASDMVSGDDIAFVDNSLKQEKEEIKYIYEDLLTGPYGCEKDLELDKQPLLTVDPLMYPPIIPPVDVSKTALLRSTLRIEYPFKLWYDYNQLGSGQLIPPLPTNVLKAYNIDKIPNNHMPSYPIGSHGPGFLSAVSFDYTADADTPSCRARLLYSWELDCLEVSDLFKHINSWPVTVGKNTNLNTINQIGSDSNISGGDLGGFSDKGYRERKWSFEQTIGIY